ncbi:MAG: PAS domain S-box protein [Myxococcales bacterium]|nr:PAS domain S-box protein [Myxococcales bacterium]
MIVHGNGSSGSQGPREALVRRMGLVFARFRSRPSMVIESIDSEAGELFGVPHGDLCGDPRLLRSLVHPDDRGRLDAAGASLEPLRFELRCRRVDGEAIVIELATEPFLGADGTCAGFDAALRQMVVPKRRRFEVGPAGDPHETELALWFDLMTEATAVALFLVDTQMVFRRFTFRPREGGASLPTDVLGLRVRDAFPDFPGFNLAVQRALGGQAVREGMRIRGVTLDVHCAPLRDADGEVCAVLGVALDLSREVSLEDARRDQEAYFQSLIQAVNDGILVNDPDGMIEYVNDRLARLLGTTARAMIGRRIFDYMDKESADEARANLQRRRGGAEDEFDFRWRRPDGTEFWSLVSAKPFYDGAGTHRGSLVAVTDITRRKLAEEAIQEAHDDLEARVIERTEELSDANRQLKVEVQERRRAEDEANRANKTKSAFLASMSHELRTPLNAIIGYSELIADEMADRGEDHFVPDIERVHGAATHLLELINDVLDLSKIEAAKMEIHMERFSLGGLTRELVATSMPLALKNDNRLTIRCAHQDAEVISDRTKLKQIILNLISNACKFTRKGSVDVEIRLGERDGVGELSFEVHDTGIGIPEEKLDAIFQAFTQADEQVSVNYGGTGLGLTISRRLAQMLGGDITVSSVAGEGSTFVVTIPIPRSL